MSEYCKNCFEFAEKLTEKEQECEKYKKRAVYFKDVNKQLGYKYLTIKQECEELKKANQHIDTNRQCKGSKLKRIEELISDCETGYTDEFIQKIYGIIQEPEPTVNDYSITDRYRKALEEIEKHIESYKKQCHIPNNCVDNRLCSTCFLGGGNELGENILDIINKAKGERNE